jgi:acetoin utilization deacetylase AcuC-like enzyme
MSFLVFSDPLFQKHRPATAHPESPARLQMTEAWMRMEPVPGVDVRFCARAAEEKELLLAHTPRLIAQIAATSQTPYTLLDPDTYATADSAWVARTAVGAHLDAVDTVLAKSPGRAFVLARPPGHHAESDRSMGFCLFNNAALAAAYALAHKGLRRVAVYDFDLHHGNGTQEIFYETPDVLYLSHHQGPFYPGTGDWKEMGRDEGTGTTVNCPLPAGSGDPEILNLWDTVLLPILQQYRPELLLVSAGFDLHREDPLGNLNLTDAGLSQLAARIEKFSTAAGAPLIYTLEGGYNPRVVSDGIRCILRSHTEPAEPAPPPAPTPLTEELIRKARDTFRLFWKL